MNPKPARRLARGGSPRLAVRLAVLWLAVTVCYALVAPWGWLLDGSLGLVAAAAAAGVCLAAATLAMLTGRWFERRESVALGLLSGTVLRLGIPLAAALLVRVRGGTLAETGMLYYLLVFYLVTLGAETLLSLPKNDAPAGCPRAS